MPLLLPYRKLMGLRRLLLLIVVLLMILHLLYLAAVHVSVHRIPGSEYRHWNTARAALPPSGNYTDPSGADRKLTEGPRKSVLLVHCGSSVSSLQKLSLFFEAQRISFIVKRVTDAASLLVTFTSETAIVVFVDFPELLNLIGGWKGLDPCIKHCKEFNIGMLMLFDSFQVEQVIFEHLSASSVFAPKHVQTSPHNSFQFTKPGVEVSISDKRTFNAVWNVFQCNHHQADPVGRENSSFKYDEWHCHHYDSWVAILSHDSMASSVRSNRLFSSGVVMDRGVLDGVRKVFFGLPLDFWLSKLLLLDAISQLCSQERQVLRFGSKRWVMVDIDDIFLGPTGTKMNRSDVDVRTVHTYV